MNITEAGPEIRVTDDQLALIVGAVPHDERGKPVRRAPHLSHRFLVQEFGPGAVMRFEDVDFPMSLTHEPTRCFLRETGLPEDGFLFQFDTDVVLPTLAEYYADECLEQFSEAELPAGADRLIRLGRLTGGPSPVLDGKYTAFGRVADGIAVVEAIGQVPVNGEAPVTRIEIKSARVEKR